MNKHVGRRKAKSFRRNATTMLLGTLVSQGLALAIVPVFTRIYPAQAIGIQVLFISWTGTLAVLATLRLDLALVIPDDDETADSLLGMLFRQAVALGAILTMATLIILGFGVGWQGLGSREWLWLVAPMVIATALGLAGAGMQTRHGTFGNLVAANLAGTLGFVIVGLGLAPWASDSDWPLVMARLVGQVVSVVLIAVTGGMSIRAVIRRTPWGNSKVLYKRFHQFLRFNTPYSLIGGVARDIPLYALTFMISPMYAAFYGIARSTLIAPTVLFSAAISNVYYREAVHGVGTEGFERITLRLLNLGLLISSPAFALVAVFGDNLFGLVYGSPYVEAGRYAMLLAPATWLALQTGWPERVFEATNRQDLSFKIQIGFDTAVFIGVAAALAITNNPRVAVAAYVCVNCVYHVSYLYGVFRAGRLPVRRLVFIIGRSALGFGALTALCLAIRLRFFA